MPRVLTIATAIKFVEDAKLWLLEEEITPGTRTQGEWLDLADDLEAVKVYCEKMAG